MKITLYGRKGHAHTVAFKNFLRMAEVPFNYKDVSENIEAKDHSKELYEGQLKYPTLFIDKKVYLTPTSDDFNKIMKDLNLRG
ncbi:glutaredoxin [Tenacibaculum sp. S7007]|uniref:Glutaredoxin n=1 Tax=Tenacibaculum pelagium TaxID=2759527 RepID=A0A839AJR0_9FLAO|nr:glutaredoxin domain-containing protein [Tenacibaculum pelagium]MBA6155343.1 glutaredoxin [Tenacibaculum pelagium]